MSTDDGVRSSTPGWYPDPVASDDARSLRYWDGRAWSPQTARVGDAASGASQPQNRPRRRRLVAFVRFVKWGSVAAFVLSAAVIVNALASGQQVKSVKAMSGEVEFVSVTEQEVERRQADIQERLTALEASARTQVGQAGVSSVDFSGWWTGDNALLYEIAQFGDAAFITEIIPQWGTISAYGEGSVAGAQFQFGFVAYDGTQGDGVLSWVDGQLVGTFRALGGRQIEVTLTPDAR
jgi:Protein of unknown function (DUF2510)